MGTRGGGGEQLPLYKFATLQGLANEVLAASRRSGFLGLHALPFNRFAPEETTWWLSPSSLNPAYRHGKIVFGRRDAKPGDLLVGLYVEKGVGPEAAPAYRDTPRGRRYIMDATWLWDRFLRAVGSGTFDQTARGAAATAGGPLMVVIDAGVLPPPTGERDPHSPDYPRDIVRFKFANGELQFLDADSPADLLASLRTAETLPRLAARIAALPQLDWVWINVQAGIRLAATGASPRPVWSATEIWEKACYPWRTWLQ